MKKIKKAICETLTLLLLLCSTITPVSAGPTMQSSGQSAVELRGTVIDETSAYIVAAAIALDDGKGNKQTALSDDRGRYRFLVKPGVYTITVEVEGFAPYSEQVDLTTRRQVTLDPQLKVAIAENVEVKDDATISTEPDKNLSAITLTEKDLEALPDDPDELLQTLRQMAGAAGGDEASIYMNGFRERGQLPPKEAILRVNISQNPYSAEYSEPGRSRIEIITKPGSDIFHGGFNFNFNDESLNARDSFATFKAPFQYRRFGGYFSGPIIRNRWGFFFDMQRNENDGNDYINAIVLDPITLLPTPFSTTVLTPSRNTNFSIRSDYLASKKHTIGAQFRHSESESRRSSGNPFNLPERATNSSFSENDLRFSLTTIARENAVNELRIQMSREARQSRPVSAGSTINVLDAFNGGSSQAFSDNEEEDLDFVDNITYTYKSHTFKAGFRAEVTHEGNENRGNFLGTFTFGQDFERAPDGTPILVNGARIPISSIELFSRVSRGIPGYRPSQFSINRGDPFVGLNQWEYGWFIQDDWKVSQRLSLSFGMRHDFQTNLPDKINFAPRFSFAWQPDKARKSTIRGGGGVFYDDLDMSITSETIRLDGEHQRLFIINNPNFFLNIPPVIEGGETRLPTIRTKAEQLNEPYLIIAGVNYERQLPLKLFGSVGYAWNRGVHLLRTRNINAPVGIDDEGPIFPFPGQGPILEYESTGLSTRHEMRINVRTGFSQKISLFGNYALAWTRNDTDGAGSSPANPFDLSLEWGRAGNDIRHSFFIGSSIATRWGFRINPFIHAMSGRPFNITTGRDNNGDFIINTDRPSFANPGDPGAIVTPFGTFNPAPLPGREIIPRNFGDGPGFVSVNLGISKTFGFGPPPNNYGAMAANRGNQQQGGQGNAQGGNGGNRGGNRGGDGGGNRGGGGGNRGGGGGGNRGGGFGGGGPVMMQRGGGGPMMMGGGDVRHKYSITISVNANDLFNHANLNNYNGVLTSPFFGAANSTVGNRGGFGGGGSRRIDVGLRFAF